MSGPTPQEQGRIYEQARLEVVRALRNNRPKKALQLARAWERDYGFNAAILFALAEAEVGQERS